MNPSANDASELTYTNPVFGRQIDADVVRTIFEIGSRDGEDAIALRDHYNADVHAFECNPVAIEATQSRLKGEPRITFVPKGVMDQAGQRPFYPVVATRHLGTRIPANIGASSFFKAREDYLQTYEQSEVMVEVICLNDYCVEHNIEQVDLLCLDVQGAALSVLKGMGERLRAVKYVMVELEFRAIYHGQQLFDETHQYLTRHGFSAVAENKRDAWFSDFLYVSRQLRSVERAVRPA